MVAPYLVLLQNYLILVIPYGGFVEVSMLCLCEKIWWNIWEAMWMKWDVTMKPGNIHRWFDIWILFWWMIGEKVQWQIHWNMLGATSLAIIHYWTSVTFLSPSPFDATKIAQPTGRFHRGTNDDSAMGASKLMIHLDCWLIHKAMKLMAVLDETKEPVVEIKTRSVGWTNHMWRFSWSSRALRRWQLEKEGTRKDG